MANLNNITALFVLVISLAACAGVRHVERPTWIDNPGDGVSASAGMHVRGRAAQEELAILRAREEYAKRFGVTIQSVQNTATVVANQRATTVGSQAAQVNTNQADVKAAVKAKWRDPDSDVLWVWLVPSE